MDPKRQWEDLLGFEGAHTIENEQLKNKANSFIGGEVPLRELRTFFYRLPKPRENTGFEDYVKTVISRNADYEDDVYNAIEGKLQNAHEFLKKLELSAAFFMAIKAGNEDVGNDGTIAKDLSEQFARLRNESCPVKEIVNHDSLADIFDNIDCWNAVKAVHENCFLRWVVATKVRNMRTKNEVVEFLRRIMDEARRMLTSDEFRKRKAEFFVKEILEPLADWSTAEQDRLANQAEAIDRSLAALEVENPDFIDMVHRFVVEYYRFATMLKMKKAFTAFDNDARRTDLNLLIPHDFLRDPDVDYLLKTNDAHLEQAMTMSDDSERQNRLQAVLRAETIEQFAAERRPIVTVGQVQSFNVFWSRVSDLLLDYVGRDERSGDRNTLVLLSLLRENSTIVDELREDATNSYCTNEQRVVLQMLVTIMDVMDTVVFKQGKFPDITKIVAERLNGNKLLMASFDKSVMDFIGVINNNNTLGVVPEVRDGQLVREERLMEEYEYVDKLESGELMWRISLADDICLVSGDQVVVSFQELSAAVNKINVAMASAKSGQAGSTKKESAIKAAKSVVEFFQMAERLRTAVNDLKRLYSLRAEKVYTLSGQNGGAHGQLKREIEAAEQAIKDLRERLAPRTPEEAYASHLLTFEDLCHCFHLIKKARETRRNAQFIEQATSILRGACLGWHKWGVVLESVNKLVSGNDWTEQQMFDLLVEFAGSAKGADVHKEEASLVTVGRYEDDMARRLKVPTVVLFHAEARGVPEAILYFFLRFQRDVYPEQKQLLIADLQTTRSRVVSFMQSFLDDLTRTTEVRRGQRRKLYILANPDQLSPSAFSAMEEYYKKVQRVAGTQAQLILLVREFSQRIRYEFSSLNIQRLPEISGYARYLQKRFSVTDDDAGNFRTLKSFFVYSPRPRVGKTHCVMSHMHSNFEKHLYYRILVDKATTLAHIIAMLREAPHVDDYTTCIHFNVDGNVDTAFCNQILELMLFGSLRDGVNIPYVCEVYAPQPVFYFEFGALPGKTRDQFVRDIFPLAVGMTEIKVPDGTRDFFTLTEYRTVQVFPEGASDSTKLFAVKEFPLARKHLVCAAAVVIADLPDDPLNYLPKREKLSCMRYEDFYANYETVARQLEGNPQKIYDIMIGVFANDAYVPDPAARNRVPLISQISDISLMISAFSPLLLSRSRFETEMAIGVCTYTAVVRMLIKTAIENCGMTYKEPADQGDKQDEARLKDIDEFMNMFKTFLVVRDPGGDPNDMDYQIISTEPGDFDTVQGPGWGLSLSPDDPAVPLLEKDYFMSSRLWNELQEPERGKEMFDLLSNMLNLELHEQNKTKALLKTIDATKEPTLAVMYKFTRLILEWNGQKERMRKEARRLWDSSQLFNRSEITDIVLGAEFKDGVRAEFDHLRECGAFGHIAEEDVQREYGRFEQKDFSRLRSFLSELQYCYHRVKKEYDLEPDKHSIDCLIQRFEDICREKEKTKGAQVKQTPFLSYALTGHNVRRIMRLLCRVHSKVPVILMGETGSGKTYTINFLASVAGPNVTMERLTVDGGFTEAMLRNYIERKLEKAVQSRRENLKAILAENIARTALPDVVKEFMGALYDCQYEGVMTKEEAYERARRFTIDMNAVRERVTRYRLAGGNLQSYLEYHVDMVYKELDARQQQVLFFFDEVNTAPCQWFLKEIMIDRYLDGRTLPSYVSFICAVNPYRKMSEEMKKGFASIGQPQGQDLSPDKELRDLVYKVRKMPESFIPFLMPADPSRAIGSCPGTDVTGMSKEEQMISLKPLSEFDVAIHQVMVRNTRKTPDRFMDRAPEGSRWEKWGDKNRFWFTDRFTTGIGVGFFQSALFGNSRGNSQYNVSHHILRQVEELLGCLCAFGCRFLNDEFHDISLTSIREAVNLCHLTRYMFRFGLLAPLEESQLQDAAYVLKRLKNSILMAMTAVFWIRLTDSGSSEDGKSRRVKFDENLVNLWNNEMDVLKDSVQSNQDDNISRMSRHQACMDFFNHIDANTLTNLREQEFQGYFRIFVDRCDGISANQAFVENLWSAYTCIINGIPLWIIGRPGTSKSLAVNTVLKKLFYRKSPDPKIRDCVPVIYQMHMCSELSTSEAILREVEKLVVKGRMIKFPYVIHVQILEELGHADLSPYLPLKCLHNIIDNGYEFHWQEDGVRKSVDVPVVLIGISNTNTDRAKLNRGIVALRDTLSESQIQKTAKDITVSTFIALRQSRLGRVLSAVAASRCADYVEDNWAELITNVAKAFKNANGRLQSSPRDSKFLGLRDFYGIIKAAAALIEEWYAQSETKPRRSLDVITPEKAESIIQRNSGGILTPDRASDVHSTIRDGFGMETGARPPKFEVTELIGYNLLEPDRGLQNSLVRHVMVVTKNLDAIELMKLGGTEEWRDALYLFAQNLTDVPDSEWTSNDLRKFARAMLNNKGRVVFVGKHPCFDSLYDVFNMYYESFAGSKMALVSYAGGSFKVSVGDDFRVIIVVNEDDYEQLSAPFLNRFEKFKLSYQSSVTGSGLKDLKEQFKLTFHENWEDHFGCCSDEYVEACYRSSRQYPEFSKYDRWSYFLLACQPSSLFHEVIAKDNSGRPTEDAENDFSQLDITKVLKYSLVYNSVLHSSIARLLIVFHKAATEGIEACELIPEEGRVTKALFHTWLDDTEKIPGIQTVTMVSSIVDIDELARVYGPYGSFLHLDLGLYGLKTVLKQQLKDQVSEGHRSLLLVLSTKNGDSVAERFAQVQYMLNRYRRHHRGDFDMLHVLLVIEMENRPKLLRLVQTTDWPVLYLDTCVKSPLSPASENLPIDLASLLFASIKDLIDNGAIDFNILMKDVKSGLQERYTEREWAVIGQWLDESETEPLKECILARLAWDARLQDITAEIDSWEPTDHWTYEAMANIRLPPTSLLNYLGQKLQLMLISYSAMYIHLLVSGVSDTDAIDRSPEVREYILNTRASCRLLRWALRQQSSQIVEIEKRYQTNTFGIYRLYCLVWQDAQNVFRSRDARIEEVLKRFTTDDEGRDIEVECVREWLSDDAWSDDAAGGRREALIAAYLLSLSPDLRVDDTNGIRTGQDNGMTFVEWVHEVGKLIEQFFLDGDAHPSLPKVIARLVKPDIRTFLRNLTYTYRLQRRGLAESLALSASSESEVEDEAVFRTAEALLDATAVSFRDVLTIFKTMMPAFRTMVDKVEFSDNFSRRHGSEWPLYRAVLWSAASFYGNQLVSDAIETMSYVIEGGDRIRPLRVILENGKECESKAREYFKQCLDEIVGRGDNTGFTEERKQDVIYSTLLKLIRSTSDCYRGFADEDLWEEWTKGDDDAGEEEEE